MTVVILLSAAASSAQDTADFSVNVPPFMTIAALRPDQVQTHPQTSADVQFANSLWLARTASSSGSTVTFATDHSFWNLDNNLYRRDVRLRLPRMIVTRRSGWAFGTFLDQSDHAVGDEVAEVQISSTGPGAALVFLEVTFLTDDPATLHEGDYQLTVIGTISQN